MSRTTTDCEWVSSRMSPQLHDEICKAANAVSQKQREWIEEAMLGALDNGFPEHMSTGNLLSAHVQIRQKYQWEVKKKIRAKAKKAAAKLDLTLAQWVVYAICGALEN